MRLNRQKSPKKYNCFSSFSRLFSKIIMFIGCLNAFMKCHGPLSSIQQKLAMCNVPFWKKKGKNYKNGRFFVGPFGRSSPFFSKIVHRNEFWFFALRSVHQDASFKLSNIAIRQFSFFTFVRGYPYLSNF